MDTCRVASVHFAPLTKDRVFAGTYQIDACPLGADPKIIKVEGVIQRDWGSILPGTSKRQENRWVVTSLEIARDIVGEWSGVTQIGMGMNPGSHPGVWVVRDRVPVTETKQRDADGQRLSYEDLVKDAMGQMVLRDATPAEFEAMWAEDVAHNREADRRYAEWCWNDGNRISNDNKYNQLIPLNYRRAASHYGLDASWLKQAAAIDSKACPSCGHLGSKHTFVCSACAQPTDMLRWAAFQAEKDVALRDAKAGNKLPPPPPVQSRQPMAA